MWRRSCHEAGNKRASWWLTERSTPMGGATADWARGRGADRAVVCARWDAGPMSRPILQRLGFEQVLQLRRVESVRSGA